MLLEKTQENICTCQICKKKYDTRRQCSTHIRKHNIVVKDYYDKFYKQENEGNCDVCNKQTSYDIRRFKYRKYCSAKCTINPETYQKRKETCFLKYGVMHPLQSNIIQDKIKETCLLKYGVNHHSKSSQIKRAKKVTCLEKYGVEYPLQSEQMKLKSRKTCLEKYGVEHGTQSKYSKDKSKGTCRKHYGVEHNSQSELIKDSKKQKSLEKYGVDNPSQSEEIKEQKRQTCLKHYGVDNPTKNKDILEKAHKSALRSKLFVLPSGKIIYKMGWEPPFLDYVFQNNILKEEEMEYHPKGMKYMGIDNKEHYYFPDFYIPKWNLIIEIKSTWTLLQDKNVHLKEEATRKLGYDYMRIINLGKNKTLDFTEFDVYCANKLKIIV